MSTKQLSKNDIKWQDIFEDLEILSAVDQSGFYRISATQINQYREARLMTKFDHQVQLPDIFKQNELSIQPDSRGTYVIGRFCSYETLPEITVTPTIVPFPFDLETINPLNLYSESTALLCAYNAGIINELLNEEARLTVLGRMSTGRFDYTIDDNSKAVSHCIAVENSQCEIDSGFETANYFAIVEAKNEGVKDFLIRQLYYPYRLWKPRTRKNVLPIFLSISDGIFNFYVYRFSEEKKYNSISIVEKKSFQIGSTDISLEDIVELLNKTQAIPEPEGVPFPQADSFSRLIDLLTQLYTAQTLTQENITTNHAFDIRQTGYYTSAGRYLGLIVNSKSREEGVQYQLSALASGIMQQNLRERHLSFVRLIIEKQVFQASLKLYFSQGYRPSREQVVDIMRVANLNNIDSDNTRQRRAQTVLSWIDWIVKLEDR